MMQSSAQRIETAGVSAREQRQQIAGSAFSQVAPPATSERPAGIRFSGDLSNLPSRLFSYFEKYHIAHDLRIVPCVEDETKLTCSLDQETFRMLMPGYDTTHLRASLGLDGDREEDLEREILLTMLGSPELLEFPGYAEFISAVRVRLHIVQAARKTQLAFSTSAVERPEDCWTYKSGTGFVILPGVSLIHALEKATQPAASEGLGYAFSCYRASEYVLLLAIAKELAEVNPPLLDELENLWRQRPIMSREFHEVFLTEFGSIAHPLPMYYFVPGDRVWFRNTDERSSDASGYEGSWVIYLGGGLFSNFWHCERPYTLTEKCVEIFHWRDATYIDEQGEMRIDEDLVQTCVQKTLADTGAVQDIVNRMARIRDRQGVYAYGGCMDATREFPRWLCRDTGTINLPEV